MTSDVRGDLKEVSASTETLGEEKPVTVTADHAAVSIDEQTFTLGWTKDFKWRA